MCPIFLGIRHTLEVAWEWKKALQLCIHWGCLKDILMPRWWEYFYVKRSVSLSCELHIYFCIHVEMSSVEHRKCISECLLLVVFIWEYWQVTVPLESVWGHLKQLEDECVYDLLYSSYKLAKEELRSRELKKKVKKLIKWLSASQPCSLCCLGY